jgi:nitrite reductase/ring-hydroxylating ferredoxin subunit
MPKTLLGKASDVPVGKSKTFINAGKKILVCNVGGVIKAYENLCPHMGGAMRYDGKKIVCSWHGACFEAATGVGKENIAEGSKLTTFTVTAEAGSLYLETEGIPKSPWADDF